MSSASGLRAIGALSYLVVLEMGRTPTYLIPTLVFPAFFYLIFAVPEAVNPVIANIMLASFLAFGVFGAVFFQFGVGLADERYQPWGLYFRTLPISPVQFLIARSLVVLVCAGGATALTLLVGFQATPAAIEGVVLLRLLGSLFLGAVPLAAMGIAFGFWVTPRAALPLGILVYLPMSYLSGMWKPPDLMPPALKVFAHWYPTGCYVRLLWATVGGQGVDASDLLRLAGYGAAFTVLAWVGYMRDDLQRFA